MRPMQAKPIIQTGPLEGVQFLRFFAAFIVVLTHATFYVGARIDSSFPLWNDGAQGVPIFFVISGLVMSLSARKLIADKNGYKTFLYHRFIRIVPLYWAVNALKIIGLLIMPAAIVAAPDVWNIILSLLFVFSRNADGAVETFYGVGWTLNYEMFFYLVFAIAMFVRIRPLYFASAVLAVCIALSYVREDSWPAITFLFNTIVINFVWGLVIAEFRHRGMQLGFMPAAALAIMGFVLVFLPPPIYLYGIQYAALVAGFVFLEPTIQGRVPKFLIFGGDSSYSLYLVHPMVGVVVAIVLAKIGVNSAPIAIGVICIVCLLVASFTYVFFEKPVTDYLKGKYFPPKPHDAQEKPAKLGDA